MQQAHPSAAVQHQQQAAAPGIIIIISKQQHHLNNTILPHSLKFSCAKDMDHHIVVMADEMMPSTLHYEWIFEHFIRSPAAAERLGGVR